MTHENIDYKPRCGGTKICCIAGDEIANDQYYWRHYKRNRKSNYITVKFTSWRLQTRTVTRVCRKCFSVACSGMTDD